MFSFSFWWMLFLLSLELIRVYVLGCAEVINKMCNFCGNFHFASFIFSYGFVASTWKISVNYRERNNFITLNFVSKVSFLVSL
jgi:hypothetical protein